MQRSPHGRGARGSEKRRTVSKRKERRGAGEESSPRRRREYFLQTCRVAHRHSQAQASSLRNDSSSSFDTSDLSDDDDGHNNPVWPPFLSVQHPANVHSDDDDDEASVSSNEPTIACPPGRPERLFHQLQIAAKLKRQTRRFIRHVSKVRLAALRQRRTTRSINMLSFLECAIFLTIRYHCHRLHMQGYCDVPDDGMTFVPFRFLWLSITVVLVY